MKTPRTALLNIALLSALSPFSLAFGCGVRHNFSHINISRFESPQVRMDPNSRLDEYSTFAIVPNDTTDDQLMEQQLLFLVASGLEGRGYSHVALDDGPDFLLTVSFSNEYKSVYIPPTTYSVPVYRPGQTYSTHTNAYVYSPAGNIYGTARSHTTTPGYWSSATHVLPGYNVGWHFPSLTVSLWDSNTSEQLWSGSNVGASKNSNLSVTAPFVLATLVTKIPANSKSAYIQGLKKGTLREVNFFYMKLSRDGTVYYPAIVGLPPGSSGKRAGLRVWDMVVELDGRSTANIREKTLIELCTGCIGKTVRLKVFRLNKFLEVEITLEALSEESRMQI